MSGLAWTVGLVFLLGGIVIAGTDTGAFSNPSSANSGPPLAEKRPLNEVLFGVDIVDNYRWLEDASSSDTQKWVAAEMAYTRKILDPLPGRDHPLDTIATTSTARRSPSPSRASCHSIR